MKPYCIIEDRVARMAINIPIALQKIGMGKVRAKEIAVDYLQKKVNIPRLVAWEVHNCLEDHHKICSQGNMLCDIFSNNARDLLK